MRQELLICSLADAMTMSDPVSDHLESAVAIHTPQYVRQPIIADTWLLLFIEENWAVLLIVEKKVEFVL